MNNGDYIKKIRYWHSLVEKIYRRVAFISQYYSKKLWFSFLQRVPQLKRVHLNSFPAVHIKRLDWYDYALKFSSELLVLVIAVTVGVLNLYFFSGDVQHTYADNSLAAKFLESHPEMNVKLAASNTSIITTVAKGSGFFNVASADDFVGLGNNQAAADPPDNTDYIINSDAIVKPNPDSVQNLIDKQIKVYQTLPGDSLKSIAAANGISTDTLKWANRLSGDSIKPGWDLLILPIDGVLHKMDSNDTLPYLAKKYSGSIETIISYNGMADAEDFNQDQIIIIPGGKEPAPPAPKTKKSADGKVNSKGVKPPKYFDPVDGHQFPWGFCTWYVAHEVGGVPWGGNAKLWLQNAKSSGYSTGRVAQAGAIVVTNDSRRFGHVAIVRSVDENGFTVSEMNYDKFGLVDTRHIPKGSSSIKGFIYR